MDASGQGNGKPHDGKGLETTVRLLLRARTGDERARNRLASRYYDDLLRWGHGRLPSSCRPEQDTGSIVQETLVSALSHLDRFEPKRDGAWLAYLRTIFMNKVRDRIRWSKRRPERVPLPEDLADSRDPEADAAREEFWEKYEAALAKLPERMRWAVFMRLELEYTYARIAEEIGSPSANAARMYATRGIRRMAEVMRDSAT